MHCDALAVLLSLRIHNINLDREKEDEIQNKKLHNKKSRVLNLSKKERKVSFLLVRFANEFRIHILRCSDSLYGTRSDDR